MNMWEEKFKDIWGRGNFVLYIIEQDAINFIVEKDDEYVNFVVGSFYIYGTVLKELQKNWHNIIRRI